MVYNNKFLLQIFSVFFICGLTLPSNAQNPYQTCQTALEIAPTDHYCSKTAEFENSGATNALAKASCFTATTGGDVWIKITTIATDLTITVRGRSNGSLNTLSQPQVALYLGPCNSLVEVACMKSNTSNIAELFKNGLSVGTDYYIRIQGAAANMGTFELCFDNYFPQTIPGSDCATSSASILCDQNSFAVKKVSGNGANKNELPAGNCLGSGETNSTWFKWTCDQPGKLTFTITPINPDDDIDFLLFELPNGLDDCSNKITLRCEAAGATDCQFEPQCCGPTGLKDGYTDTEEPPGCSPTAKNFLAPLVMQAGKSYALMINNYSGSGNGFNIEFGDAGPGVGTFVGAKTDFTIDKDTVCAGDTIHVTEASPASTGSITSWNWTFGANAIAIQGNNVKSTSFVQNTPGRHNISLTVKTKYGCQVSTVKTYSILELPKANFEIVNDSVFCEGQTINVNDKSSIEGGSIVGYDWNFGQGATPATATNVKSASFKATTGIHTATLMVTSDQGCKNSLQKQYEVVTMPVANFNLTSGDKYCLDQAIEVEDLSNVSGVGISTKWTFDPTANPKEAFDQKKVTFNQTSPGAHSVTLEVTNRNRCTSTAVKPYTVFDYPKPDFDVTSKNNFCVGSPIDVLNKSIAANGDPVKTLKWNFGAGAIPDTLINVQSGSFIQNAPGSYNISLDLASENGCSKSTSKAYTTICCINNDIIKNDTVFNIYIGDSVKLALKETNPDYTYQWIPADNLSCSDCPEPVASPLNTTNYQLNVTDAYGCTSTFNIQVFVNIRPEDANTHYFVPTGFSPNEDGNNDYFTIYSAKGVHNINFMKIYNRWGALLWEGYDLAPNDERKGWDGYYKGKPVNNGTYTYIAEIKLYDNTVQLIRGSVDVVR